MNRDALVTALAALALAGCATSHLAGAPPVDPLAVANNLPPVAEPVTQEAPPAPEPVVAPPGDPMTAALLRARLVAFVGSREAEAGQVALKVMATQEQRLVAREAVAAAAREILGH